MLFFWYEKKTKKADTFHVVMRASNFLVKLFTSTSSIFDKKFATFFIITDYINLDQTENCPSRSPAVRI